MLKLNVGKYFEFIGGVLMAHIRGNLKFSKAATQFINNTNRFSFDAELYQHGPNKVNMLHFHDFYEFTVYLGKEPAKYALGGQEHEVVFGDIVRCDLMDEHVWLLNSNEFYTRFTVGLSPSFVMSSS